MLQSIENYWNISNRINSRRSQTSILYIKFAAFFHWGAVHANACKGPHERTENYWSSFQAAVQNFNHFQVYFCRIRSSLIVFDREAWRHLCNTRTCTHVRVHIIFPCISLGRSSLTFCPRKKYVFGKKIPSFQTIQER